VARGHRRQAAAPVEATGADTTQTNLRDAGNGWQLLRGGKPPLARFDAERRAARRAQLRLVAGGRDDQPAVTPERESPRQRP
jgi:hypothetical protein